MRAHIEFSIEFDSDPNNMKCYDVQEQTICFNTITFDKIQIISENFQDELSINEFEKVTFINNENKILPLDVSTGIRRILIKFIHKNNMKFSIYNITLSYDKFPIIYQASYFSYPIGTNRFTPFNVYELEGSNFYGPVLRY